ncbi:hypothetical protein [Selenomonas sp. AB3002]|uniref:hypothetical protein n=1 Tax=Selenomonas sp. AB3002 TaxID=1392502 RepID=UPI0004953D1E
MSVEKNNQSAESIQTRGEAFLTNVDADYHQNWSEPSCITVLFVRDELEHSKKDINRAIREAAKQYETRMRDAYAENVRQHLNELEDLQEEYEAIFKEAQKTYVEPSPSFRKVRQEVIAAHDDIVANIGGLGSRLVDKARFDSLEKVDWWNPFEETHYLLANNELLMNMAESYFIHTAMLYNGADIMIPLRSYLRSLRKNVMKMLAQSA